jgi:hypothetical protein
MKLKIEVSPAERTLIVAAIQSSPYGGQRSKDLVARFAAAKEAADPAEDGPEVGILRRHWISFGNPGGSLGPIEVAADVRPIRQGVL